MVFKNELIPAVLVKRYKRFLADVILENGSQITAYCPNTGSMRSCIAPGSKVLLSISDNPKRKYNYTLEMVHAGESWVGVNTSLTNTIVAEAIEEGLISELRGIDAIHREVKTSARTRLDLMVERGEQKIYIEIKNCSLVENGVAMFPDAVTERGTKHLYELAELVRDGHEGVIFYLVQRTDANLFRPAEHIDPKYSKVLRSVYESGVKILVYQAEVGQSGIFVNEQLPYELD